MLDHAPRDEGRQVWVIEDGVQRPLQIRLSRLPSIQRHAENRFYGGGVFGGARRPWGGAGARGVEVFARAVPRGGRGIYPHPDPPLRWFTWSLPRKHETSAS